MCSRNGADFHKSLLVSNSFRIDVFAGEEEVGSSNPSAPTNLFNDLTEIIVQWKRSTWTIIRDKKKRLILLYTQGHRSVAQKIRAEPRINKLRVLGVCMAEKLRDRQRRRAALCHPDRRGVA